MDFKNILQVSVFTASSVDKNSSAKSLVERVKTAFAGFAFAPVAA